MAIAKAKLRFYRQSPRKVRQVVDILRGLDVASAEAQLEVLPKRAALALQKLLASAVANAENTGDDKDKVSKQDLYISEIRVDQGPTYKRFRPRAHGRAGMIRKRTSHISLVLDQKGSKAATAKVEKAEPSKPVEAKEKTAKKAVKKGADKKSSKKKPAKK